MQTKHKIIQVGNSAAVTIPQSFLKKSGWKVGDEVYFETNPQTNVLTLHDSDERPYTSGLTPEFKDWLDNIKDKYGDVIKELAHR